MSETTQLRRLALRVRDLAEGDRSNGSTEHHDIADALEELATTAEQGWESLGRMESLTARLRVPGGWLYRFDRSIALVPEATATKGCHLDVGDRILAKILGDQGPSLFEELRVMRATEDGLHMETKEGHELTLALKRHGP